MFKEVCVKFCTKAVVLLCLLSFALPAFPQTDPGLRGGTPSAGGPLASVASDMPPTILSFFTDGQTRFVTTDSVAGMISGETGFGLGPRYNSRSCGRCHSQPAIGGSSPATNPQVADATADGATNTVPSFILSNQAVKEARFVFFTDASGNPITTSPNGGVEDLYTIAGRSDAGNCTASLISQPNFASASSHNNIIFRIPTPVFGAGLIENIDDMDLLTGGSNPYGISREFNRNGNDGTISRFGWKAQNKSLEIFAGEAYNVEMGVSNELFTQERPLPEEDRASGLPVQCRANGTPEDHTNFNKSAVATGSDTVQFAMFMRLLAPPSQVSGTGMALISVINGEAAFGDVGCTACHRTQMTTGAPASGGPRITASLENVNARLFSDLAIHHMGTSLADNIQQGNASGDQFRTAPLWGLGQRIWFLHDGRTNNLLTAINWHSSTGSEANAVIANFNALSASDKQDILNFLRSL
jgi:CxxC motif-containing protein (DUF1111 family)